MPTTNSRNSPPSLKAGISRVWCFVFYSPLPISDKIQPKLEINHSQSDIIFSGICCHFLANRQTALTPFGKKTLLKLVSPRPSFRMWQRLHKEKMISVLGWPCNRWHFVNGQRCHGAGLSQGEKVTLFHI